MAGFLGDLTVLATTLAVWGGLLLIRCGRTESSALLKAAGSLALVVGVGTGLYAGLYAVKYHRHGDLGRPFAIRAIDDKHSGGCQAQVRMAKETLLRAACVACVACATRQALPHRNTEGHPNTGGH